MNQQNPLDLFETKYNCQIKLENNILLVLFYEKSFSIFFDLINQDIKISFDKKQITKEDAENSSKVFLEDFGRSLEMLGDDFTF